MESLPQPSPTQQQINRALSQGIHCRGSGQRWSLAVSQPMALTTKVWCNTSASPYPITFLQKAEGEKAITHVKDLLGWLNPAALGCRYQYYRSTHLARLQDSTSIQPWGFHNSLRSHARALQKEQLPITLSCLLPYLPQDSRAARPSLLTLPWRKNKCILRRTSFPLGHNKVNS